jgi:probable HAF family extracellular repeat protein
MNKFGTLASAFVWFMTGSLYGQYTVTSIDAPTPSAETQAVGINNSGSIVGWYGGASTFHGFLYSNGSFTPLDVPGAVSTQAWEINDAGHIVGHYRDTAGVSHGFVIVSGSVTAIDVPTAQGSTQCQGINNLGQIVGTYKVAGDDHGFLYSGGTFTPIDYPGAQATQAVGINDAGTISGYYVLNGIVHGYVRRTDGVFTSFEVSVPGTVTYGLGINTQEHVAGFYDSGGINHGFVFTAANATFSFYDVPGAARTLPEGINDAGILVGTYDSGGNVLHGFVAVPTVAPYGTCLLYDPSRAVKSGSTIPIKIQVCNANGNQSSANLVVHAISVSKASNSVNSIVEDAGNANPDNDFRFDLSLAGYIFNLTTKGLTPGTYNLNIRIGSDTTTYSVPFQVK